MPLLIALLAIIVAAYFWSLRAQRTRDIAVSVADMANDVRLAARRFGFKRQTNLHPVESIDDARLAIAAIATSFMELDDLPTAEDRARLIVQFRAHLKTDADEAREMEILGRWFMTECGGADAAIARVSRKLYKLGGPEQMDPLMAVLKGATTAPLSDRQRDALEDITRAMRVR